MRRAAHQLFTRRRVLHLIGRSIQARTDRADYETLALVLCLPLQELFPKESSKTVLQNKKVLHTQHSLGHFGDDVFTGQMTQPTVSKH